jgi:hypothetical protein
LACELAERIGQSEIQLGAMGGMALCHLSLGQLEEATRLHASLEESCTTMSAWFQGRELVEALAIRLAILAGRPDAAQLFTDAARRAHTRDPYAGALLTAEFGATLREMAPDDVDEVIRLYAGRPEVVENPRLRQQFGVLMFDSASSS